MTFPGARTFLWRRNEDLFLLAAEWKSLWLQKIYTFMFLRSCLTFPAAGQKIHIAAEEDMH